MQRTSAVPENNRWACTQLEAEATGRQDALRRAAAALQEAEAKTRLAVALRRELDEAVEATAHLEAELVAAQVSCANLHPLIFPLSLPSSTWGQLPPVVTCGVSRPCCITARRGRTVTCECTAVSTPQTQLSR